MKNAVIKKISPIVYFVLLFFVYKASQISHKHLLPPLLKLLKRGIKKFKFFAEIFTVCCHKWVIRGTNNNFSSLGWKNRLNDKLVNKETTFRIIYFKVNYLKL